MLPHKPAAPIPSPQYLTRVSAGASTSSSTSSGAGGGGGFQPQASAPGRTAASRPATMSAARETTTTSNPRYSVPSASVRASTAGTSPVQAAPQHRPSLGQARSSNSSVSSGSSLAPPPRAPSVASCSSSIPTSTPNLAATATGTAPKPAGFYLPPPGYPRYDEPEYDVVGGGEDGRQDAEAGGRLPQGWADTTGRAGRYRETKGWGIDAGFGFSGEGESSRRDGRRGSIGWPLGFFGDSSTHRDWTLPQAKQILSSYATLAALLAGTNTTLLGYYGRASPVDSSILALCYAALVLDIWGALLAVLTIVVSISLQAPDVAFLEKEARREKAKRGARKHRHRTSDDTSLASTLKSAPISANAAATAFSTSWSKLDDRSYREEAARALLGEGGGFALGPLGRPRYEPAHPLVYGNVGSSTLDGRGKPLSPLSVSILDRLTLACGYIIPLGGTLELASLALHVALNDPLRANLGVAAAGAFCFVTTGGCLVSGWIAGRRKVALEQRRRKEREEEGDHDDDEEERMGYEVKEMHGGGAWTAPGAALSA